jgi:hypothetical protein
MPAMSVDRDTAIEMAGDFKQSMSTVGGALGTRKPLSTIQSNQEDSFEDSFVNDVTGKLANINSKRAEMMKK